MQMLEAYTGIRKNIPENITSSEKINKFLLFKSDLIIDLSFM